MPTLTGLPALIKRIQVLAGSAVARLSALATALVAFSQSIDIEGIPAWIPKLAASLAVLITAAAFQVRMVTPVAKADQGLLPPKGPAAEADPNRDVGDISLLEVIVIVIAVGLFILALKVY